MYEVVRGRISIESLCEECPVRAELQQEDSVRVIAQSFPQNNLGDPVTTVAFDVGESVDIPPHVIKGEEVQSVSEIESKLQCCSSPDERRGLLGQKVLKCAVLSKI